MAGRRSSDDETAVAALAQCSREPMPAGFWISEENYNRLERVSKLATMLACVDAQVAEHAAISRDSVAAAMSYIAEDLRILLSEAIFMVNGCRDDGSHGGT